MRRDHRATRRADLVLLLFVVLLVGGVAYSVLGMVGSALEVELEGREPEVLGDSIVRETTP